MGRPRQSHCKKGHALAGDNLYRFVVGIYNRIYFNDFEGATDEGWVHQLVAQQDDWQRGIPAGKVEDPSSAYSGDKVWGNDLGPSGFNGSYASNVENWLESPVIDCSGQSGVRLRFARWLTVEEGKFDQATIRVNGTEVWSNPQNGHLIDEIWTPVALDISSEADGQSAVSVEWRLVSDGGLNLGGWNLDDVRVVTVEAVPTDCVATSYGLPVPGTSGVAVLDTGGQPPALGNADFGVVLKHARPGAEAFLAGGLVQASVPFAGGEILVVPLVVLPLGVDLFGQARFPVPLGSDPGLVGVSLFFQGFVIDPAAPQGIAITAGLQAQICP